MLCYFMLIISPQNQLSPFATIYKAHAFANIIFFPGISALNSEKKLGIKYKFDN